MRALSEWPKPPGDRCVFIGMRSVRIGSGGSLLQVSALGIFMENHLAGCSCKGGSEATDRLRASGDFGARAGAS